jgi:hypothetical protein
MRFNTGRLSERLAAAVENSRDERIMDFYGTGLDADAIMEEAERLAHTILGGAQDVISSESVAEAQRRLHELFSGPEDEAAEALRRNVMQVMDEVVGESVVEMQATAENRLLRLVLLGARVAVDWRTADYLRRISRCYLFGLDEQCVILCRTALEAAYLHAIPDTDCVKHCPKEPRSGRKRPEYSLRDRIEVADKAGRLDKGQTTFAKDVKNRADDLLHPERTRKILDQNQLDVIVLKTIQVIEALTRTERGDRTA